MLKAWLQSTGDPASVTKNFQSYLIIRSLALRLSFITLLISANMLDRKERHAWDLWFSLLIFANFIFAQRFFIDRGFFNFHKENSLTEGTFLLTPILGVAICAVSAFGVFFERFLVTRMREKIVGNGKDEVIGTEEIQVMEFQHTKKGFVV